MSSFFRRIRTAVNRSLFRVAHNFDEDGLYVYKRPVRSDGDAAMANLLAMCGSVLHHNVVYVKRGERLDALEFGPDSGMDITLNFQEAVRPGPIRLVPAPEPEPECLPMLHLRVPHHALEAEHVRRAVTFCEESTQYHALKNNCIAFADFLVRVLTGGAVQGAPLIFDAMAGDVPPVDHPTLALMSLALGISWHAVTDGSRLMAAFLEAHPGALVPLPDAAGLQVFHHQNVAPSLPASAQAVVQAEDSSGGSADTETALEGALDSASDGDSQQRSCQASNAVPSASVRGGVGGLHPRTRAKLATARRQL